MLRCASTSQIKRKRKLKKRRSLTSLIEGKVKKDEESKKVNKVLKKFFKEEKLQEFLGKRQRQRIQRDDTKTHQSAEETPLTHRREKNDHVSMFQKRSREAKRMSCPNIFTPLPESGEHGKVLSYGCGVEYLISDVEARDVVAEEFSRLKKKCKRLSMENQRLRFSLEETLESDQKLGNLPYRRSRSATSPRTSPSGKKIVSRRRFVSFHGNRAGRIISKESMSPSPQKERFFNKINRQRMGFREMQKRRISTYKLRKARRKSRRQLEIKENFPGYFKGRIARSPTPQTPDVDVDPYADGRAPGTVGMAVLHTEPEPGRMEWDLGRFQFGSCGEGTGEKKRLMCKFWGILVKKFVEIVHCC